MSEKLYLLELQEIDPGEALELFGPNDIFLKQLETQFDVKIVTRGEQILVSGTDQHRLHVEEVLNALLSFIKKGLSISERDLLYAVNLSKSGKIDELNALSEEEITKNVKGKPIRAKTLGQKHYVEKMMKDDVTFGIGPAGTGKTYLAVVLAVRALRNGSIKKIILTRPAVEAGESLGFLPGDLQEKVDPYLRPLYDALHDVLGTDHTARLIERETIEIAPLAYMRGRTLDDAFVILDEAQNTTPEQMKMFLTRLGFNSKMVITGDITQVDLPKGIKSGLKEADRILKDVKGLSFIYLDQNDVVRHPLVQKIIHAYETMD